MSVFFITHTLNTHLVLRGAEHRHPEWGWEGLSRAGPPMISPKFRGQRTPKDWKRGVGQEWAPGEALARHTKGLHQVHYLREGRVGGSSGEGSEL